MIASSPPQAGNPDDIDGLLGEFFRGEVPQRWPAAPLARQPAILVRPTTPQYGGRLALAASVAALLLGGWLLSGRLPKPAPSGSMDDTNATVPAPLRGGSGTPVKPNR